ncbi:Ger(x)C family spore germination protein [Rossellomorea marisflavi]|uniref:Ger(x)C family spore germination protein n=1 Tax=Rossellomorea marisflavi TaxID=189381 RepID=UPI001317DCAF|nr:Ger(x)C family spore germination protein [Rossellomorea marisflavi]QHA37476.1 Ger(x)C family spore germination protein [Rossellomorea marisflavi]
MKRHVLLIFMASVLLSGCVEKEILDDLYLETGKAYDYVSENRIRGTAVFPIYMPDKSIENGFLSEEASSTQEVIEKIERRAQQPLVRGALDVVLIGEKLSEKGIIDIADSLQRDASVGARVFLIITEGDASDVIQGTYGNRGNGIYIYNLIEHNISKRELPETNLHMFLYDYYQKGQSSYLPIIKKTPDNNVAITGIALLSYDKVVGKIPDEDMFFFKIMVDRIAEGSHVIKMGKNPKKPEKNIEASVTSLHSKQKIIMNRKADPVKVDVEISIRGIIKEYTGDTLGAKQMAEVENRMKADIENKCNAMVKSFQELGIDPLGIGQYQKHGVRGFDLKEWKKEVYPKADIKVKAKVKILEAGTVE